jgi:hypothetical protein
VPRLLAHGHVSLLAIWFHFIVITSIGGFFLVASSVIFYHVSRRKEEKVKEGKNFSLTAKFSHPFLENKEKFTFKLSLEIFVRLHLSFSLPKNQFSANS